MEHMPRSKKEIEAELANVQEEILALEENIKTQHEESGSNSLDDNGQEAVEEQQNLALIASQLDHKRQHMMQLQEELQKAA